MDEDEGAGVLPREVKMALAIVVIGLVALGLITVVDVLTKRAIVRRALEFDQRMGEYEQRSRTRPDRASPGPPVSAPVPRVPRSEFDPFAAGAPPPDGETSAAQVVRPGDESARPPHRGGGNGA